MSRVSHSCNIVGIHKWKDRGKFWLYLLMGLSTLSLDEVWGTAWMLCSFVKGFSEGASRKTAIADTVFAPSTRKCGEARGANFQGRNKGVRLIEFDVKNVE